MATAIRTLQPEPFSPDPSTSGECPVQPVAQAFYGAGLHFVICAPRPIEAGHPLVKCVSSVNQPQGFEIEQRHLLRIGIPLGRGQAPMATQLKLAQIASKICPLIKQPCQRVHHPGGGAQRLARKRDAGGAFAGSNPMGLSQSLIH